MTGLDGVVDEVLALRESLVSAERARADDIAATDVSNRRSATNLIHYVELRSHDIRDLQARLGLLGLSSLGRAEPYVLATLEAVLTALAGLRGDPAPVLTAKVGLAEGQVLLCRNADRLLGPTPERRSTRIMVTLPSEAADDESLIANLRARGMDVARINCANDDASVWDRMIVELQCDAASHGRPCRIAMDLAGPKLRTGPLQPGPRVVRIKPKRDNLGRSESPGRVRLSASSVIEMPDDPDGPIVRVPVADSAWLCRRRRGDLISFTDSRGSHRQWTVTDIADGSILAAALDTAFVTTGLTLECRPADTDETEAVEVGDLAEVEQSHRLRLNDRVILTRSLEPAVPTPAGVDHFIGCSLSEAFDAARPGERVWLDDGKIGGTVQSVTADQIALAVTDVRPGGAKLRAGNGINLPDTDLRLDALTAKDLDDLAFVAGHADIVELSFVRRPEDMACEAAHIPVIWATQVLDTLARTGQPSRAEVTDAAMSERAECVMLNKGPYITDAISTLDSILTRMQDHQDKKRSMLRQLFAWTKTAPNIEQWAPGSPSGPTRTT